MRMRNCVSKKNAVFFLGGVAVSAIGAVLTKSGAVRRAAVCSLAKGMKLQKDVMACYEGVKEEASDVFAEAQEQAKQDAVENLFE